jgi:hypothetical protein
MDRPIIHPQYVANLLDTMRKLDSEATEELLLLKVPVNESLRKHPTIHFYDDQLTIFGALAGMTSDEAPYDGNKADPHAIIDFFNSLLTTDHNAIKELIQKRVPINWELAGYNDLTIIVDTDCDGEPSNPRLGILGILNGLVGVEDNWGKIAVEIDERGKVRRFVVVNEYNRD